MGFRIALYTSSSFSSDNCDFRPMIQYSLRSLRSSCFLFVDTWIVVIVEFRECFFRTLFLTLIEAILKRRVSFSSLSLLQQCQTYQIGHWSWPVDNKYDIINFHIDSVPQLRFQTTKTRQQLQDTQRGTGGWQVSLWHIFSRSTVLCSSYISTAAPYSLHLSFGGWAVVPLDAKGLHVVSSRHKI
jgi:hypothetical protein